MMEHVLALLGGGGLGAITGPILGFFKNRQDAKIELAKLKHLERMEELGIQETKVTAEANIQVAAEATRGAEVKGELLGWRDSYKDARTALSAGQTGIVGDRLSKIDFLRGLIRPLITLVGFTSVLGFAIAIAWTTISGGGIAALATLDDYRPMKSLIHMTETSVMWWFGLRGTSIVFQQQPKVHPTERAVQAGAALRAWGVPQHEITQRLKELKDAEK